MEAVTQYVCDVPTTKRTWIPTETLVTLSLHPKHHNLIPLLLMIEAYGECNLTDSQLAHMINHTEKEVAHMLSVALYQGWVVDRLNEKERVLVTEWYKQ